jgi:hypothetical protein
VRLKWLSRCRIKISFCRFALPSILQFASLPEVGQSDSYNGRLLRGMRITVYDVLSYLAAGMSTQQVLDDFLYLTAEDIHACLE